MSKSAHTEAQIIAAVKQKYGGMDVAEAHELRHLREENAQ